jgi:hypothetical protein
VRTRLRGRLPSCGLLAVLCSVTGTWCSLQSLSASVKLGGIFGRQTHFETLSATSASRAATRKSIALVLEEIAGCNEGENSDWTLVHEFPLLAKGANGIPLMSR